MYDDAYPSVRLARRRRRRPFRGPLMVVAASSALGFVAWTHLFGPGHPVRAVPSIDVAAAPEQPFAAREGGYDWMFDPAPVLAGAVPTLGRDLPLAAEFLSLPVRLAAAPATATRVEPPAVVATASDPAPARLTAIKLASPKPAPSQMLAAARVEPLMPLPVPRPSELRRARAPEVQRLAARPVSPRTQTVFRAAIGEEPSFLETLFGTGKSDGALAYASTDGGAAEASNRRRLGAVAIPSAGGGTAIYDISARAVYLPSGEAIEAHSGLGPSMDNPRHVHLSMRGSTPPGTYDLTEREALFHGVRAIRLNPVGGSAAIHGRVGLLAHTYMLGPSGASNGCVSFRNYDRFLQAFLRGEVRRLVVVAGNGQDGPPSGGDTRLGLLGRLGRSGG